MNREIAILRLYFAELSEVARDRRDTLDRRIGELEAARCAAEAALAECHHAATFAERIARFTARADAGDVDENDLRVVVGALEHIAGVTIDVAFDETAPAGALHAPAEAA